MNYNGLMPIRGEEGRDPIVEAGRVVYNFYQDYQTALIHLTRLQNGQCFYTAGSADDAGMSILPKDYCFTLKGSSRGLNSPYQEQLVLSTFNGAGQPATSEESRRRQYVEICKRFQVVCVAKGQGVRTSFNDKRVGNKNRSDFTGQIGGLVTAWNTGMKPIAAGDLVLVRPPRPDELDQIMRGFGRLVAVTESWDPWMNNLGLNVRMTQASLQDVHKYGSDDAHLNGKNFNSTFNNEEAGRLADAILRAGLLISFINAQANGQITDDASAKKFIKSFADTFGLANDDKHKGRRGLKAVDSSNKYPRRDYLFKLLGRDSKTKPIVPNASIASGTSGLAPLEEEEGRLLWFAARYTLADIQDAAGYANREVSRNIIGRAQRNARTQGQLDLYLGNYCK